MELVFVLSIFLQQIGKSKKSATQRHLVQNPRIPTWTSTTHLQVQKIGNVDLLQMHETCQELVWKLQAKLVKFCTALHTRGSEGQGKKSNPIKSQQTHMHAKT